MDDFEEKVSVLSTKRAVADAVADRVVDLAAKAAARGELFGLVLSGGSTPEALYAVLAERKSELDWQGVELFFGDERCVPPDDARSNYAAAKRLLIDRVPIPPDHVHRIKGELEPEAAATEYGRLLQAKFPPGSGPDLVLLGMGDDGHTASLFPGTTALGEAKHRCVANHVPHDYVPAGTAWRVTVTYPFLRTAKELALLVTGASKRARLAQVLEGEANFARLPVQAARPMAGGLRRWWLDAEAAGMDEDDEEE